VKTPEQSAAEERRRTEAYLKRVEDAETLYEVLGVAPHVTPAEIKTTYFALAKRFHPDIFHREAGSETHRRIQAAFTEIAHAYEILKDQGSREIYDFKNREKLSAASVRPATETPKTKTPAGSPEAQATLAKESFDQGYSHLMDGNYEEALPLLARAVHLAPASARYHVFYGKVLAVDEKSVHKAESEMQAAIKLDPNNSVFRIMLAEFYIEVGLARRAEGELQRLLAMFPGNKEARNLLDSLRKK
ncbi:MAG TPA: DnaJ domain-containing protein, partial [Pyrinomonadaceae bacterium]|nr:DnaJ domain-containing protein [Pyrinomonadaceae bacterium]